MGIKEKWTRKPYFGFNPYRLSPDDSMDLCYARHLADPTRIMRFGGRAYYKIIDCFSTTIRDEPIAFIIIDAGIGITLHDTVLDENGNKFEVRDFPMFSFGGPIPDWYMNTLTVVISGDTAKLGEYLTHKG